MTGSTWNRRKEIFWAALRLPTDEREAFVRRSCGEDVDLRASVERLLELHPGSESFLEAPRWEIGSAAAEAAGLALDRGYQVASRYEIVARLGGGTSGAVYRALDTLTNRPVAVKLLGRTAGRDDGHFRRETAALRLLRIPGVVAIVDDGEERGHRFVVTELVEGTPFPGRPTPCPWELLEETARALLETLARVHAAGVVHGDLKPANVLVDAHGRPTLLDLGLSAGPAILRDAEGHPVEGTPFYLAPERFEGAPATPASDLYSVGVLLCEALTGALPHDRDAVESLARAKREVWTAIRDDVKPRVRDALAWLLAVDPAERPASAAAAIAALFDEKRFPRADELPRLGTDDALRRLVAAASRRESVDLWGSRRSGRTRCIDDLATELAGRGVAALRALPGTAPLSSLRGLPGIAAALSVEDPREAIEAARRVVLRHLAEGRVVLADDAERLDPWSGRLLEECRDVGGIVRARIGRSVEEPNLDPLAEGELRALVLGPDRLFHLREDAAKELWRRTGGLAGRVVDEIRAWTRAGLAHWEGGRLRVERGALDRLSSGALTLPPEAPPASDEPDAPDGSSDLLECLALLASPAPTALLARLVGRPVWAVEPELEELRARHLVVLTPDGTWSPQLVPSSLLDGPPERRRALHAAIARTLPPGSHARLLHLLRAGDATFAVAEASAIAAAARSDGRVGEALSILEAGLVAARTGGAEADETRLLGELLATALADGSAPALSRCLYAFARRWTLDETATRLHDVARAALAAVEGSHARAIALLDRVGAFAGQSLERVRLGVLAVAARRAPMDEHRAIVARCVEACAAFEDAESRARVAGWIGWLRYAEGQYGEAARLHEQAAAESTTVVGRLVATLHAASARLEAGELDEAGRLARHGLDLSRALRHAHLEARAEWLARSVAYRTGLAASPDDELVEAASSLGVPNLEGLIALNEAAVAWRLGERARARTLAELACDRWRRGGRAQALPVARALAVASGAPASAEEVEAMLREAAASPVPSYGIQAFGLLAPGRPGLVRRWRPVVVALAKRIPRERWPRRAEVLSVLEVLEAFSAVS